jgi:predicted acylesterase/phospholipase RssA
MESERLHIALAFSGGGYRAAAFNLGVLSYLHSVKLERGTLLEQVAVLSTVSGGTITGAVYALGIKKSLSVEEIYSQLYRFMSTVDIPGEALKRLGQRKGWTEERPASLINAIADVYNEHLFSGAQFGELWEENPSIHLKHISFNATEFTNALQFRFQLSEVIQNRQEGEPERGIVGNSEYRIPWDVAKSIRMADILAASSCFPGGFEPIVFPNDFGIPLSRFDEGLVEKLPVGLMDGGIVDNQGIEPILLAEARMKRNLQKVDIEGAPCNTLDLAIVSDVASPYMEGFQRTAHKKGGWWRGLTMKQLLVFTSSLLVLCTGLAVWGFVNGNLLLAIPSLILASLSAVAFVAIRIVKAIPKTAGVPLAFRRRLLPLLNIPIGVYENLVSSRVSSMLIMTGDVFLKHIRRLNYRSIFAEKTWKNRRIMNAIYELRPGEKQTLSKLKEGSLPPLMHPSEALQKVAAKASSMGTTLWFTKEELQKDASGFNMLDHIISTGQATMCWNLLEYIEKLKGSTENTCAAHKAFIDMEAQLKAHWELFQRDSFWKMKISNPTY